MDRGEGLVTQLKQVSQGTRVLLGTEGGDSGGGLRAGRRRRQPQVHIQAPSPHVPGEWPWAESGKKVTSCEDAKKNERA